MQNAAIEMHWLMVNHVSRLKKAEKPKMLVWRTEFGRGVFFGGKLNKPCGYWFCQKWLLIISKRPKKSSEWCYFNLTPPTDDGTILRRSPHKHSFEKCKHFVSGEILSFACTLSIFLPPRPGWIQSLIIVELLPYIKRVSKQDWEAHSTSSNNGEREGFYPHVPFYLCLNLLSSLIVHMTKKSQQCR